MKRGFFSLLVTGIVCIVLLQPGAAAVVPFWNDLSGFNTAAGSPAVAVDFDSIAPGTDINGMTFNGITFSGSATGAAPFVIKAADSYTPGGFSWSVPANKLYDTTEENVLSPGGVELAPGPNPALENDDMILTFAAPVNAVGFDLLFQSLDGASYVAISVLDSGGNSLYSSGFIPTTAASGNYGGSNFVGFVSDTGNIAKIVIDEFDENSANPDSNIGMDTIRAPFTPPQTCVDDLAAVSGCSFVQLSWTDTGADRYNVYRGTIMGGPYLMIGSTTAASYTDASGVAGTTYSYVIREEDALGREYCQSNEGSAMPVGNCVPEFPSIILPVITIAGLLLAVVAVRRMN